MPTRTLKYVPLSEILRADLNPKLHAGRAITASMDRFGFLEPILRDGRTGKLIAGHGRLEELQRRRDAGDPPPEGIRARKDDWLVPVVVGWSSRTDDEAHAAGVALNRIVEMGGWDVPALFGLLEQLPEGYDLADVGFTAAQLDDLLVSTRPETFGGKDGGARTDTSLVAKAETYRTNGVRSLVLDYPLDEYEQMQVALRELRRRMGAESNATVVQMLLAEASQ